MNKQQGFADLAIALLIAFIIFSLLIGIAMLIENLSCKAKWKLSGMSDVTWGPIQGCLVKLPDGRWIPEDRIREVELQRKP